jgi:hypothetical protein
MLWDYRQKNPLKHHAPPYSHHSFFENTGTFELMIMEPTEKREAVKYFLCDTLKKAEGWTRSVQRLIEDAH